MSRFIMLNYTTDDNEKASVLINVNEIQTITFVNSRLIVIAKDKYPYVVDHSFEEVMKMIDKAGGTIVKPKGAKADHKTDPVVIQLFEDLLDTYGTFPQISKALQEKCHCYANLATHSLTERLKRLQINHEKLDTVASKRNLLNDCKALLDQQVEAK